MELHDKHVQCVEIKPITLYETRLKALLRTCMKPSWKRAWMGWVEQKTCNIMEHKEKQFLEVVMLLAKFNLLDKYV